MPQFETQAGVKLFYEIHGEGQPLIFIHPPLMGHVVFRYQKALREKYQVILYDCRGHGQSTYQKTGNVIEDHVADLRALITHLDLDKHVIVGYSNGGTIALEYTLTYRDEVSALILSGGYPKVGTWLLQQEYHVGIWLMKRNMKTFLSWVLAKSHKVTQEDQEILYRYALKARTETVLDLYLAGKDYNEVTDLHKLKNLPILLLYGTKASYISEHKKYFGKRLPDADIVIIDKGTHQLPTRFHNALNGAIMQFLGQSHFEKLIIKKQDN